MNLDSMTTDELKTHFPQDEDNKWEFKSADLLTKDQRNNQLRTVLGKQISAFANSGGGYLVFGVEDGTRKLEPCDQSVGGQSMKDFLSNKVSTAVDKPIGGFHIHRIPFTNAPTQAIYVISIPDSLSAPHQSNADRIYYWRLPGKSEAAPHFHLELLRNRSSKSILEIENVTWSLDMPEWHGISASATTSRFELQIYVNVKNTTLFKAQGWGILVQSLTDQVGNWKHHTKGIAIQKRACWRGHSEILLPDETGFAHAVLSSTFSSRVGNDGHDKLLVEQVECLNLSICPVSHDHIGQAINLVASPFLENQFLDRGAFVNAAKQSLKVLQNERA